jgi:guanylate kinase
MSETNNTSAPKRPHAILFSAPSGSGKTTIIRHIMQHFRNLEFSISATSRPPRQGEQNGVDYYFLSPDEFRKRVNNNDFLEWEEVYTDTYYGTLKAEVERISDKGNVVVFDVDVNGGINIKRYFGNDAIAIFVMPPSMEVLEQRLRNRGTDSEESIVRRLARSAKELDEAKNFDITVINDDLNTAVQETKTIVADFIDRCKN